MFGKRLPLEFHEDSNSCVLAQYDTPKKTAKLYGFDLDGTLIKTKSGLKFPRDARDWQLLFPKPLMRKKILQLHSDGYTIVVISNQLHTGRKPQAQHREELKEKLVDIANMLDFPAYIFLALARDSCRKPGTGCLALLKRLIGEIDPSQSVFVGDAAGREGDHSTADLGFAINAGWSFKTPENFFVDKPNLDLPLVLSTLMPSSDTSKPYLHELISPPLEDEQEVLFLLGAPGSGKSFVARQLKDSYEHVNQDALKTREKCVKQMIEHLTAGANVIIDRQNTRKEDRKPFIQAILKLPRKLNVRAVHLDFPKVYVSHNNTARTVNCASLEHRRVLVPPMVFSVYFKQFEPPLGSEGFHQIQTVRLSDFRAGPFVSTEEASLFGAFYG